MKCLILMMNLLLFANAFALDAPKGFKSEKVKIDGITYNVFRGGKGSPLLLIHGYGQSALMWSKAMEHYKDKFSMIIPDIRGSGDTDAPDAGYDKITMAEDMKKLLDHYQISKSKVVGHDIGLMVAYTLAARYPQMVERLALMDAFLPGIGPGVAIYNDPNLWHFRFHGPYAEKLVKGRENIYFNSLWVGFSARPDSFPEDAKKYYLKQYTRPGRMKAGFAYFETFPLDAENNNRFIKTKLPMPVYTIAGEKSMDKKLNESMVLAATDVGGKVVAGCGHWMLEECPRETLEALDSFLLRPVNLKQAEEEKIYQSKKEFEEK